MSKVNLSQFVKNVRTSAIKHSPEILVGLGIAGMISATILAVKATPTAMRKIDVERKRRENESKDGVVEPLTKVDVVKATWTCYVPTVVTIGVSTACLVGASSVNARRNAALATAYTLSETALKEYREKVVETIGEKKEEAIRDQVVKERLEKNPVKTSEVIISEKGNTLCYDCISGRYFKSDIEKIKKAVNEINRRMMSENYISLNEFYYEIGLKPTALGNELGWNMNDGFVEPHFSSQLADDEQPCLAIDYYIAPRYDFGKLM